MVHNRCFTVYRLTTILLFRSSINAGKSVWSARSSASLNNWIKSALIPFRYCAPPAPGAASSGILHHERAHCTLSLNGMPLFDIRLPLRTIYTFVIIKRKETGMKLKLVKMCFIVCAATRHTLLAAGHDGRFDYRASNVLYSYIFTICSCRRWSGWRVWLDAPSNSEIAARLNFIDPETAQKGNNLRSIHYWHPNSERKKEKSQFEREDDEI